LIIIKNNNNTKHTTKYTFHQPTPAAKRIKPKIKKQKPYVVGHSSGFVLLRYKKGKEKQLLISLRTATSFRNTFFLLCSNACAHA